MSGSAPQGARWQAPAFAAVVALLVAGLGGLATDIGPWYRALEKPPWQPPDWLFGPAWTLIYTLTATAAVLAWRAAESARARRAVLRVCLANAALNVLWSVLFFSLKRPDWALLCVLTLWMSIVCLVRTLGGRRRLSGWLLLPYLGWVAFAALLNAEIVWRNPAFG